MKKKSRTVDTIVNEMKMVLARDRWKYGAD